ncbi:hypothetical protein D3C71_1774760 [compost metagenome]
MGQFVHQRTAPCASGTGHIIIKQIAAQRDTPGEGTAMHVGGQVVTPADLHLRGQGTQQAVGQQRLHISQCLHCDLLLRRAQPGRVQLQALSRMRSVSDQQ